MIQDNRTNYQNNQLSNRVFVDIFKCCQSQTQEQFIPYLYNDRKKDGQTNKYYNLSNQNLNTTKDIPISSRQQQSLIPVIYSPVNYLKKQSLVQGKQTSYKIESQELHQKLKESQQLKTKNQNYGNIGIFNHMSNLRQISQIRNNMMKSAISQNVNSMMASTTYNLTSHQKINVDKSQLEQLARVAFQHGYNLGLKNGQIIRQNQNNKQLFQFKNTIKEEKKNIIMRKDFFMPYQTPNYYFLHKQNPVNPQNLFNNQINKSPLNHKPSFAILHNNNLVLNKPSYK